MAKVYSGKVAIRGDQLEEYVAELKRAELQKAPLKGFLSDLNQQFSDHLEAKYSERTARKTAVRATMMTYPCKGADAMSSLS